MDSPIVHCVWHHNHCDDYDDIGDDARRYHEGYPLDHKYVHFDNCDKNFRMIKKCMKLTWDMVRSQW